MQEEMKHRTKRIGLEVIKLIDELPSKPSAWTIAKQIVKSSTSIGANYRAACRAKSTPDFLNKLKIVEEEADETIYWLEVLIESGLILKERVSYLLSETNEILSIIVASINTIKNKSNVSAKNLKS
jgi:four helix bundle protein